MTKSLAITNKDLDVQRGQVGVVVGVRKLIQDMSQWLVEEYRIDRFHPDYGSTLSNMVGENISETTKFLIQNEVLRVLRNFQSIQLQKFRANPSLFSLDQLLDEVVRVETKPFYDAVYVTVFFRTALQNQTHELNFTLEV